MSLYIIKILSLAYVFISCSTEYNKDLRSVKKQVAAPPEKSPPDESSSPKIKEKKQVTKLKEDRVDGAIYFDRAFDKLTPEGSEIFFHAKEFVKEQKSSTFDSFAQPLQCARNVSYLMTKANYGAYQALSGIDAVPTFLKIIRNLGGKVYELPRYQKTKESKANIIKYLNQAFSGKIPTGAIIAGCKSQECQGEGSSAHMAILGDKNAQNDLMLYHNNWFRPNNLRGKRTAYMVSLHNFYDLERPRQWMATPWINLIRNEKGEIIDIKSKTPGIDDLDPLNGGYYIKVAIPPKISSELEKGDFLKHHRLTIKGNPHTDVFKSEANRKICRSKLPFKSIDARVTPDGAGQQKVLNALRQYEEDATFLDFNFEFIIKAHSADNKWVSIKTYDANTFWGDSHDNANSYGKIWLRNDASTFDCFEKKTFSGSY